MQSISEIWVTIPLGERNYSVSSLGRVRNDKATYRKPAGYIISQSVGSHGYLACSLNLWGKKTVFLVHRLVALGFIGPCPNGQEVLHDNGDRLNCSKENIKYGTRSENQKDRVRHGTSNRGERCAASRLDEKAVREIRDLLSNGESFGTIAKKYNVGRSTIQHISQRTTWGHLK